MHHVAIMNKSWHLIPKILSGEKSIESRWYQTRRTPWGEAHIGDTVFFKNAGEPVTAHAIISEVMQFEIQTIDDARRIVKRYGKDIAIVNPDPMTWGKLPKYCILLRLKSPMAVKIPFHINKKGFGTGAAWLTTKDVKAIKFPM